MVEKITPGLSLDNRALGSTNIGFGSMLSLVLEEKYVNFGVALEWMQGMCNMNEAWRSLRFGWDITRESEKTI